MNYAALALRRCRADELSGRGTSGNTSACTTADRLVQTAQEVRLHQVPGDFEYAEVHRYELQPTSSSRYGPLLKSNLHAYCWKPPGCTLLALPYIFLGVIQQQPSCFCCVFCRAK